MSEVLLYQVSRPSCLRTSRSPSFSQSLLFSSLHTTVPPDLYRDTSRIKKKKLGTPYVRRHRATVGSYGAVVSYEQDTPRSLAKSMPPMVLLCNVRTRTVQKECAERYPQPDPPPNPSHATGGPDHYTRSRTMRTTPTSRSSTRDPSPSRGCCPIANAVCKPRTQWRPHATE